MVRPGRAFLGRLIALTLAIRSPEHKIRLNKEVKEDLKIWLSFLCHVNGRSFFLEEHFLSSTKLNLFTDASGALGFGVIVGSHWCYGKWPPRWDHKNIAILEFYPIVLSLHLWGEAMCNQCILFCTYNESLVHVTNKQSCKDKSVFARKRFPICLHYNIVFKAKHIPGVRNKLADSLSRLQVHTFKQLSQAYMDPLPHGGSPEPQSWLT